MLAAQEAVRDTAYRQAMRCLQSIGDYPAVAYVFANSWCDAVEFKPGIGTAVQLYLDAFNDNAVYQGQIIRTAAMEQLLPEQITAGKEMVQSCVTALNAAQEPYVLLTHVHTEPGVTMHFGGGYCRESALVRIAEGLAEELSPSLS